MPEEDLEPLITECPSCGTRFRVSEAQLQRARGRVRCGACLTVFHGVEHLVLGERPGDDDPEQARQALDDLLDELASGAPGHTAQGAGRPVPELTRTEGHDNGRRARLFGGFEDANDDPAEAEEAAFADPSAASNSESADDGQIESAKERPQSPAVPLTAAASPVEAPGAPASTAALSPAERKIPPGGSPDARIEKGGSGAERALAIDAGAKKQQQTVASRSGAAPPEAGRSSQPVIFGELNPRRPLVWVGIVAGAVLLVAQVLWYQFDDWATQPGWRGLYGTICGVIGCQLPVQRDVAQLGTRNLVVRIHPREPRSLLVNAVIVNGAEFAQPFPVLELQFTTVRGNLVASRRFHPDEYLAGDATGMTLIPPRTPVQIELTFDDPGPDAVNYRLNFR